MDLDQSMSEDEVKSWSGTYFQTDFGLCCVAFLTPSNALAIFVFKYFAALIASLSVLKVPILINVSVAPSLGPAIREGVRVSPKAPELFASVNNTLKQSK